MMQRVASAVVVLSIVAVAALGPTASRCLAQNGAEAPQNGEKAAAAPEGQEAAPGGRGALGGLLGGNRPAGDGRPGALVDLPFDRFLVCVALILGAIMSGAALAFHPLYVGRVASLVEMDYPKIILFYSVVGAVVGFLVITNEILGLAVFGIGGLMRFRTEIASAKETGRAIFATLIGIIWGLGLWQVAVATTAVAWVLILVVDWRVGYRMLGRGLESPQVEAAANAYRDILAEYGCQITQVRKNPRKGQFSIVFKASRRLDRDELENAFDDEIAEESRATIDWPEEG